jgi:amino acid adenylation domain-containing protein
LTAIGAAVLEREPSPGTAPLRAVFVGSSTLLLRCADRWRETGHAIEAVFSDDATVSRWTRDSGVTRFARDEDLASWLSGRRFDFLFSIVNYSILRPSEIALASRGAINFHDGPLPRYAGLHATSWALLNGETSHGITWHLMDEGVDTGHVLEQVDVEIRAEDTAFSLNVRCYEAAFQGFTALADRLADPLWREGARPQDRGARTVYGKFDKPFAGGFLRWSDGARRVESTVRALDFGPAPNTLGVARLWTGKGHLWVGKCSVESSLPIVSGSSSPGAVLHASAADITIASATTPVRLSQMRTPSGDEILNVAAHFAALGYSVGDELPILSEDEALALQQRQQEAARHESRWREVLAGAEPLTVTSRARTSAAPPDALWFAGRSGFGMTPGRFAALSFIVYLGRLTNRRVLTLGLSVAPDALERFGLLASRVPITFSFDPRSTWAETLRSLDAAIDAARARGSFTVDWVLHDAAMRSQASTPMPVFIAAGDEEVASDELAFAIEDDGLRVRFHPDSLAAHWVSALRGFASFIDAVDSATAVSVTPFVSQADLKSQFEIWNATTTPYPTDRCLHRLFEEQAIRTPEATALIHDQQTICYRELDERATAVARILRSHGLDPEARVGICLPRSIDMVVAILAVLKAGAAYVPLDPSYPEARNHFIAADAKVTLLLGGSDRGAWNRAIPWLDVGRLDLVKTGAPEPVVVSPSQLAYLIYTSGSTGRPKGVAIEHRNAVAMVAWALHEFSSRELERVLASTSICFDMSVFEIFAPLSCGGSVVIVRDFISWAERGSPAVSLVDTVPSAIREYLRFRGAGGSADPDLCAINLGGELLPQVLVEEISRHRPGVKVRDLWGPSEATTFSSVAWRRAGDVYSIGRPISNTRIYILNEELQPIPTGFAGEAYVAGAGVARGYLDRSELTDQCFLPDPFEPGDRMFRTRDLCRFLPDGRIEYIQRTDNLVKVRGFRVELGEIETTLLKHDDVERCVVAARPDHFGHTVLVAYVVMKGTATLDELRRHVGTSLPSYMVPLFVALSELPLNPNGKVDRARLPAFDVSRSQLAANFEPPRNEIESTLSALWSDLLHVESIGIQENFFELGGTSLLAVRLQEEVAARLQVNVSIADLLMHPTIASLADALDVPSRTKALEVNGPRKYEASATLAAASMTLSGRAFDDLPEKTWMGLSQLPFWFAYHPDQFNVPLYMALTGEVDERRVRDVLNALPRQFPSLRYAPDRAAPILRRASLAPLPLTTVDHSTARAWSASDVKRFIVEHATDFKHSSVSPQMQAFLIRTSRDGALLALKYPHYLGDGYSNTLIKPVIRSWWADGVTIAPTEHFVDEIDAEARAYTPDSIKRLEAFWAVFLHGASNLRVPAEWYSKESVKDRVLLRLSADAIEQTRRARGVLHRTLYGAALLYAFRELTGNAAPFIRNFVLKRRRDAVRETLYPRLFLEAIPCVLSSDASPAAVLATTHDQTTALQAGQDVLVPLAFSSLFSHVAGKSESKKGALASVLRGATNVYAMLRGAPPEHRFLLGAATSDFFREPGQVDVYLNYVPAPGNLDASDAALAPLLVELSGDYRRRCDGSFRDFFGLDVLASGETHVLSLDSPFTDEIDARILALVRHFLDALGGRARVQESTSAKLVRPHVQA